MTSAVASTPERSSGLSPSPGEAPTTKQPRWTPLWRNPWAQSAGCGLLFTVLGWTPINISPTTGLDASWSVGLAMGFVRHIAWGPNLDFTYGPLGFLSQATLFFGSTAALATLFLFLIDVAMFSMLVYWWRLKFPLPVALVLSYVTGATASAFIDPGDRIVIPVTLFGLLLIRSHEGRRQTIGIAALGVLSGVAVLEKVSDGVVAIAILMVVAIASGGRRRTNLAVALASLIGTIVAAWLASGNSLANIPQFVRYATASASGYAGAMQIETGRTLEWWLAGLVLAMAAAVSFLGLRSTTLRERVCFSVILTAATWWALKEGFVRHDSHDLIFFGFMLVVLATVPATTAAARAGLLGAIGVATASAWIAFGSVPPNVFHVRLDANALRSQVRDHREPGLTECDNRRGAPVDAGGLRAGCGPGPRPRRAHRSHRALGERCGLGLSDLHLGSRAGVAGLFGVHTFARRARRVLSSVEPGAQRILQQPPEGVDGRYPFFEPPSTWVAMTCRYAQLDASGRWQVLRRIPNRCGTLRPIVRTSAVFGERIRVPSAQPGMEVVARFTNLSLPIGYTLSSILLKPPTAAFETSAGTFRFIIGTAGDLHLIRPGSTLGYSPPFMPASLNWFALSGAGVPAGKGHVDITFYSLPITGA